MAFHHFHKHKQKYLVVTVAAMVFTMFVFSIPQALEAFTGDPRGEGDAVWLKFETAGTVKPVTADDASGARLVKDEAGAEVEITNLEKVGLDHAISTARLMYSIDRARTQFPMPTDLLPDSMFPIYFGDHAAVTHAIVLAEAEAMGIEIPPELVTRRVADIQERLREIELLIAQNGGDADGKLTKKEWREQLDRVNLNQTTLEEGLHDLLKCELFVRSVVGVDVVDPTDVRRYYNARHQNITLEYVAFTGEQFLDQLEAEAPEEAELEEFFARMDKPFDEFYHPERYTLDVAVVDFDAVDFDQHSELMTGFAPPIDDQWKSLYEFDRTRYGDIEGEILTAADIPQEIKDKILLDEKMRFLMETAQSAYRDAIAQLDASNEEASDPEAGVDPEVGGDPGAGDGTDSSDGGPFIADPWNQDTGDSGTQEEGGSEEGGTQEGGTQEEGGSEEGSAQEGGTEESSTEEDGGEPSDDENSDDENSDDENSADENSADEEDPGPSADELLDAQQRPIFERIMSEHGLESTRHESLTEEQVTELDPPGDPKLGFTVQGFRSGLVGESVVLRPSGEGRHGCVLRLAKYERSQPKTLDEVRDKVLESWREDEAAKRAKDAARTFRDGIREQALASAPQAAVDSLNAAWESERKEIEEDENAIELLQERELEALHEKWFTNFSALVGVSEGELMRQAAQAQGVSLQQIGPFRRSRQNHPHFEHLHEGAERFLMQQDSGRWGTGPDLLGYAVGCVSDVLEDTENNAYYIAQVSQRSNPEFAQMSMKEREQAKSDCDYWARLRRGIDDYAQFSPRQLLRLYQPQVRRRVAVEEVPRF